MDTTLQYIPILIVGFAASLGLTPVTRQLAMRLGVVDKPNLPRKTHKDNKPMMGGLAIVLALSISVFLFSPAQHIRELIVIIGGVALLAIIGLIDDRYNLHWLPRFGLQFVAAGLLIAVGIQIRLFGIALIDIPITLIWVVALTNALNFLDNMDGVTAGVSAIASAFFLVIAILQGQVLVSMLAAGILGSAIGFLTYNFAPSSTFMGDMGALPLGFLLATLAIKLTFSNQPISVSWMIPILVLALPVFDISLVVIQRLSEGRSPVDAGRDHITHRIKDLGVSPRQTLLAIYAFGFTFGLLGFATSIAPTDIAYVTGGVGIVALLTLYVMMWFIRVRSRRAEVKN